MGEILMSATELVGEIPKCCGSKMKVDIETTTFIELLCKKCGDRIYIKKPGAPKPQMLDD